MVSVSITPTDNTNKILVLGHTSFCQHQGNSPHPDFIEILLLSIVQIWCWLGNIGNDLFSNGIAVIFIFPVTTSAITYKIIRLQVSGTTMMHMWNYYSSSATHNTGGITVMEVVV